MIFLGLVDLDWPMIILICMISCMDNLVKSISMLLSGGRRLKELHGDEYGGGLSGIMATTGFGGAAGSVSSIVKAYTGV